MERINDILNRYYNALGELKAELERYGDPTVYRDHSQEWRVRNQEEVMEKAKARQAQAKQHYIEALNIKISRVEDSIDVEIPSVLTGKMAFTENELVFLAKKYADNHFALRRIEQIAKDLDYKKMNMNMQVAENNPMKELSKLQTLLDTVDRRFKQNPFHDTPQAQMELGMGVFRG